MSEDNERETVVQQAMTHGEPSAGGADLEQVFRQHYRQVLRAAYRVTGSAQDAEDVLQTVFLRLVRREGGSPLSDSPAHYLHRAAINAALDVIRSRQSARSAPLEDVEPMLSGAPQESPDRIQDGVEIREQIRQALSKMSAKNAEIFALRYFEGYGNHEIAKMLGTSRSTINVILHRTRQKMREEIGPYVGEAR